LSENEPGSVIFGLKKWLKTVYERKERCRF
jgi:hypothetical protein